MAYDWQKVTPHDPQPGPPGFDLAPFRCTRCGHKWKITKHPIVARCPSCNHLAWEVLAWGRASKTEVLDRPPDNRAIRRQFRRRIQK